MNLCDLQIITGLGILISGFYCITETSAYHWQIIVYLAWFANITHITTLTFLRDYFHSRKDLQQRNLRIFAMPLLLLLLLVAEFPTGFFNWSTPYLLGETLEVSYYNYTLWRPLPEAQVANASSYAICFFNIKVAQQRLTFTMDDNCHGCIPHFQNMTPRFQDTTSFQGMIISMILLVINFGSRVVKLSMTLSSLFNHKVRKALSQWFRSLILRSVHSRQSPAPPHWPENRRTYIITKPLMALLLVARLYVDLGTSTLAEVSSPILGFTVC